jgi:hypothetical protein
MNARIFLVPLALVGYACDQPAQGQSANVAVQNLEKDGQVKLERQRIAAEALVNAIRAQYEPANPVYKRAATLYSSARSANNAYIARLVEAYKDNLKDVDLSALATDAETKNKQLTDYVTQHTKTMGNVGTEIIVALLVEIGKEVLDQFGKMQAEKRQKFASFVKETASWRDWEEIPK